MSLEHIESIGFLGIILEIVRFILMIKFFGKKPTETDWQNWQTRNLTNKGFTKWEEKDISYIEKAHNLRGTQDPVHRRFVRYWDFRSKYVPIGFVIFGLILQGIQMVFD